MPSDLGSLSSIAAEASGLDDEEWEHENVTTSMPPSQTSSASKPDASDESDESDESDDSDDEKEGEDKGKESWWEWLTHKADEVEEWVEGFVGNHTGKGEKSGKDD
jgi:hypothetical protein